MSAVKKKSVRLTCPHCSKKLRWVWIIRYESLQFVRLVSLCPECESVIKTENEKVRVSRGFASSGPIMGIV